MPALTAMDTQPAYREGYEAFHRGSKVTAVPYHESTDNFKQWLRGWRTAAEEAHEQLAQLEINSYGDPGAWDEVDLVGEI